MRDVKVLLTENVDNLGIVGDVVEVRPGYARNFLYPRGMAAQPTPGNIKRLAARRAEVERQLKEKRARLEEVLEKLKNREITLQRSHNEQGVLFGGVTQHDIAQLLRDEGLEVEDRAVRIGATIKRLDSYSIPVVLAADLKTEIKLWVVSDKPAEQLQGETQGAEAAPAADAEGGRPRRARPARKDAAEPDAEAVDAPAQADQPRRKPRADAGSAG